MYEYDEECLQTFLNMQSQLFDERLQRHWKRQKRFWKTVWRLL